jgi:hypothetical protein
MDPFPGCSSSASGDGFYGRAITFILFKTLLGKFQKRGSGTPLEAIPSAARIQVTTETGSSTRTGNRQASLRMGLGLIVNTYGKTD